jgi:hypothetical protein
MQHSRARTYAQSNVKSHANLEYQGNATEARWELLDPECMGRRGLLDDLCIPNELDCHECPKPAGK